MIKLACTSRSFWRSFEGGSMSVMDFVELCRGLHLDGVDLEADYLVGFDHAYLWQIKRACLQGGLSIANVALPSDFTRPPAELPAELEKVRMLIDVASFLNAPMVSLSPGSGGPLDEAAWARLVAYLRAAAEYGQEVGLVVAVRNDRPDGPLAAGEAVLKLVQDVSHPNFGYTMHAGQFADPAGSVPQTAELALHIVVPAAPGAHLDVADVIALLRQAGYNGFVALDLADDDDPRAAVAQAVPALRGLLLA